MIDAKTKQEAVAPPAPAPAVQHDEPQAGGSYTRDINTGSLVKNELPADATTKE